MKLSDLKGIVDRELEENGDREVLFATTTNLLHNSTYGLAVAAGSKGKPLALYALSRVYRNT